jgi:hypothetical protein
MTVWLLWQRGLKGPEPVKLEQRGDGDVPKLDEYERKNAICEPIRVKPEDERLAVDLLARLYPMVGK